MSSQNTPVSSPKKAPVKKTTKKVVKKTEVTEKVPAKAKKVSKKNAEKAEKAEKVEVEAPAKKARVPSLAAKYNKYIQFSFYMIRAMNAKCLENNEDVLIDEEKFFEKAHVFDIVDNQQGFVSEFLENKGIAKEMRAHVADQKKAAKVAEKEAVKAAKVAEKLAEKEAAKAVKAAEKASKGAEKASKGANANKTKKATKNTTSKKGSVDETDLVTSLVTLATTGNQNEPSIVEEEEPELDVRPFNHDGVNYLIDDNNNLYDSSTHEMVGSFDVVNRTIIRV